MLSQLKSSLGGATAGGLLSSGSLSSSTGLSRAVKGKPRNPWRKTGANKQCTPSQLEQAVGPEVLETLCKQTGLSRGRAGLEGRAAYFPTPSR